MHTIAVVAPGAMGAGIGRHLVENGAKVITNLEGRGPDSQRRAQEAGIQAASLEELAEADLLLSIVPPGSAVALAERLAPALTRARRKPVVVDANAISPQTANRVKAVFDGSGCPLIDGCIIGAPPKPHGRSPAVYVAGDSERLTGPLAQYGLDLKPMEAPFGAAKALKMSYAICTKAVTAIAAGMLLGADRNGIGPALRQELHRSQPEFLARSAKTMPDMLPKAYRWIAEMREIATFLGSDDPAAAMLEGAARMYERLAADWTQDGDLSRVLLQGSRSDQSRSTGSRSGSHD